MENVSNILPDWALGMNCAVTVCDIDGVVIYMNEKALATFASHGELVHGLLSFFICYY